MVCLYMVRWKREAAEIWFLRQVRKHVDEQAICVMGRAGVTRARGRRRENHGWTDCCRECKQLRLTSSLTWRESRQAWHSMGVRQRLKDTARIEGKCYHCSCLYYYYLLITIYITIIIIMAVIISNDIVLNNFSTVLIKIGFMVLSMWLSLPLSQIFCQS